jgi:periplasmic protein TonB
MTTFAHTILPWQEDPELRRWGIAALVVILAHIAFIIGFISMRQSDMPPGQPPDAVMINLAPIAMAPPPQEEVDTPPQPDQVQPVTPPDTPPPPIPLPPQTNTQAPVAPDVLPAPQAEVQMSPPPPPPPPKVEEKPVDKRQPPKPVKHEPKPRKEIKSTRTNLPRSETSAAPRAGYNGAAVSSWKSEIVERINSVKEYPSGASAEGTATVSFSVDRSGRVLGSRLSGSSGSSVLDHAAVETLYRANPLPAPPPDVPGNRFSFTVPLHFSTR